MIHVTVSLMTLSIIFHSFLFPLGPVYPLDLAFVFDGSDSLTEEEFENVKQFATSIVKSFDISPRATRVGLLEYSFRPRIVSKLTDNNNENDVIRSINNLSPSRGYASVTSEALQEAARNIFSVQAGGRSGVPKALILLAHSKSSSSVPVEQAVRLLRSAGVRVYVVGIGTRYDTLELRGIASGDGTVYFVEIPSRVPEFALVVVRSINEDIKRSKCADVEGPTICFCRF